MPRNVKPTLPRVLTITPIAAALMTTLAFADSGTATLSPVVITANPLKEENVASPTTVLDGDELTLRQTSSLGETLNGLPGISSSYFGPVASRPIIRGFDGDRIRLLRNGVGALDASALSNDHAVPQDPNSVDRIEIVRGPAALLYGGSAIGGVINTFDNRIPTEPVDGIHGAGELRYGGADTNRSAAGKLEAGDGRFALHLDADSRSFNDLRIPGYAHSSAQREADGDDEQNKHRLANSDGRADGGAVGGSYTWADGYMGLSYSGFDSNYGSPAEDSVRIAMHQDHYAFSSEVRNLEGPFSSVKVDAGYTDYEHKEIDDGEVGTTFLNEGYEARVEARHQPIGPLEGVIGGQISQTRFSALGEEAFVPHTKTDTTALFIFENWSVTDRLDLSFGGRVEHTTLDANAKGNERFDEADGSQSFTAGSFSTGAVYKLNPVWALAGTLSYTERAPTYYEVYANGAHEATGTYEVGESDAGKEKAYSGDLALRFDNGTHKGSFGIFYSDFSNYIGLTRTGRYLDEEGDEVTSSDDEALPEYVYEGVKAEFYGVEAQDKIKLSEGPYGRFDLELAGDYTRAKNKDTGEALPRIAPLRLNSALLWSYQSWQAKMELEHAASQHRVPENDTSTDGYTTVGASLGYGFELDESRWLAYVKGENLTNETVRYASSILRDIAPAPGRGVEVGLKVAF